MEKRLTALIVDDDQVDLLSIKRSIKLSGFNVDVISVSSFDEGIRTALANDFDCIFTDYNLPGDDGVAFINEYRQKGGTTPVIIITSHGDERLAVEVMKSGACDYIPKSQINAETVAKGLRYAISLKASHNNASKIQQALSETEEKLDAVISKSPLLLFSIDENGIFTLFKGKVMEQLHLFENEVIGKSIYELWNRLPVKLQDIKNVLLGKEFTQLCEFNGRHFEVHFSPVKNSGGAMGIVTDITGHKEHEKKLKDEIVLAVETQKIKELFLANMSHEIRTPIHGIISLTKIILQTQLQSEQTNYLNAIRKSADNLLVIINDILDFSKIEAEKMTFEDACFSLRDLTTTIIELFKPRVKEKNIGIVFEYDKELPDLVKGDAVRLSQILNNLLGNAVKFTHEGEVKLSLEKVESNDHCTMIRFNIKDTGIGIPKTKLATIFDSFSQVGTDTTRKYGGTGLGLSIAKKLVELQGGVISVDSILNAGTTFTFSMPFNNPAPGEVEEAGSKIVEKHTDFKRNIKLLVVEDNDINRLIINKHIIDWGFEHDIAENGVIALEKIQANDYDVVLMDIEMPEMNGYQAAEKIRKTLTGHKQAIPILAMTAHASSSERDKCLQQGMNDYISKPFDPIDVKNKIIELAYPQKKENINSDNTAAKIQAEEAKPEVKTQNTAPKERLTNTEFLKQMSDSTNSFFKEFIGLFLQNIPQSLNELAEALTAKNWEKIRQVAHKMKPSMNYVGLKKTYEIVINLEQYAKQQINLDDIPDMIRQVTDDCNVALIELEEELKTVSAHTAA